VLAAVESGALAPGQGAALLSEIGTPARVADIDELVRRVEALEGKREQSWLVQRTPSIRSHRDRWANERQQEYQQRGGSASADCHKDRQFERFEQRSPMAAFVSARCLVLGPHHCHLFLPE
jgi:hypothetical protein